MSVCRIVCEMGKAEKSQYTGNVQVCVGIGECRPEFMAKTSKYYYFVVSVFFLLLNICCLVGAALFLAYCIRAVCMYVYMQLYAAV